MKVLEYDDNGWFLLWNRKIKEKWGQSQSLTLIQPHVSLSDVLVKMNENEVLWKLESYVDWNTKDNYRILLVTYHNKCSPKTIYWQLQKSLWQQSEETRKAIEEILK